MEVKQEIVEIRRTTTFNLTVSEMEGAASNQTADTLAQLIHKALTTANGHPATIDPEQAELHVQEAPAPAKRLPVTAGGQPLSRCPYCHTDIVWYKLDTHKHNASCRAREKRNATALRRQRKAQQRLQIAAPKAKE